MSNVQCRKNQNAQQINYNEYANGYAQFNNLLRQNMKMSNYM